MKDELGKPSAAKQTTLSALESPRGEFDFISKLRARTASVKHSITPGHSGLVCGIGDDAAVIRSANGKDTVVTADLLVEDIDFRRTTTPPLLLGHKALAVSLSDVAAMGARPRWSVLSVGVPEDIFQSDFVDQLYEGLLSLAARYDVQLIGGDTSRTSEKIVVDSTLIGECDSGFAVHRSGAKPGDLIFVTGTLGGAAGGLRLIERGAHVADQNLTPSETDSLDHLLLRQLRPEPRVGWGLVLGQERLTAALIDISDGLSSDLNHLCEASGVGAYLEASRIPIDTDVADLCGRRALDPLQLALNGGEDFELLFTVRPELAAKLPRKVDGVPITQIGEIKERSLGIKISEGTRVWELKPGGYEHFS
ncbi:MAG TPA: thiamine-phosphate kinase [Pyrinomonadaceae bacterium]|nr:thiamine-phosphate kinase [Pyrinomonadaceae bacterium]